MGWTSYHVDNLDRVEEIRNLYTWKEDDRGAEVLDIAIHGAVVYVAVHYWNPDEDNVHAAVVLTRNNNSDYFNFAYKDMGEDMNPYYYDCPKRILDLLTPTNSDYANEWRRKCAEKRERTLELRRLKGGARIKCAGKTLQYCMVPSRGHLKYYWFIVNPKTGKVTWEYFKPSYIIERGWEVINL